MESRSRGAGDGWRAAISANLPPHGACSAANEGRGSCPTGEGCSRASKNRVRKTDFAADRIGPATVRRLLRRAVGPDVTAAPRLRPGPFTELPRRLAGDGAALRGRRMLC